MSEAAICGKLIRFSATHCAHREHGKCILQNDKYVGNVYIQLLLLCTGSKNVTA